MSIAHKLGNIDFGFYEEWFKILLLTCLPKVYQPLLMTIEISGKVSLARW